MTIRLTDYALEAGAAWTFTALITAPDATTIFRSAIAYLIEPINGDLIASGTIKPLTGYITFQLTPTGANNQFTGTGTMPANETSKLLVTVGNALDGIKKQKVQLAIIVYEGTTNPIFGTTQGESMKSDDITPFVALWLNPTLQPAV